MIEPNASVSKLLQLTTYPSKEGVDNNNTYGTFTRIAKRP
jgi:hypothetical protein